jgi:hypothetical protein
MPAPFAILIASLLTAAPVAPPAQAPLPKEGPAEADAKAAETVAQIRSVLKQLTGKLEQVRASHDLVQVNCVNDKVTRAQTLLRISQEAHAAFKKAIASHEGSKAEYESAKLTVSRAKAQGLGAEAAACSGQLAFRVDHLPVHIEQPVDLPKDDPTQPNPAPVLSSRPPAASPTQ